MKTQRVRALRRVQRDLFLERLESRALLAGNVTATQQGNNLVIRGDNEDNEIAITRLAADEYLVTGVGTTVNGDPDASFSGISGNIDIDLRGGDDILAIADDPTGLPDLLTLDPPGSGPYLQTELDTIGTTAQTFINGALLVRMGSGDDFVGLSVETGGRVDIRTGSGLDAVGVLRSDVGGNLSIRTEDGDDGVLVLDSFVDGNISVDLGNGFDGATVQQVSSAGGLSMLGGRDSDGLTGADLSIADAIVLKGAQGNDDLEIEFAEAASVRMEGGDGDDELDLDGTDVFGDALLFGGNGIDNIEVEPTDDLQEDEGLVETFVEGLLLIDLGAGGVVDDEEIGEAELVTAHLIKIIGGSGADELDADGVTVTDDLILLGGSGDDFLDASPSDDELFLPDGRNTTVGDDLVMDAGSGNDELEVRGIIVVAPLQVPTDPNEFLLVADTLVVVMGSGNDSFDSFENVSVGGTAVLNAGAGNDDLGTIFNLFVGGNLEIFLGSGIDFADLTDVSSEGHILIDAGSGDDQLRLENVAAIDYLLAKMGSGNSDELTFVLASAASITLDGGPGNDDTLFIADETGKTIRNFENIVLLV